ncbi:mucin-17-like isoform X10 [Chelonus insularis]|uniref:mucin-17-like isoform X10 n=1 Tax=Chelonus insularis TaxID=460826 RepID=UPI00158BDB5B|nr:mucin-17-like isoform X10 [Chelonus insularis]
MTRRSSWFVVILVLVVLFVRSDCLRKSITHNEGQNLSTTRSRGNARFSLKAEEGLGTTSEPLTTTSRSNRRSNNPSPHASATLSRRRTSAFTKTELTTEKVTTGFSLNPGKSRSKNTSSSSNGDLIRAASGDRRYLPDSSSRKKLDKVEEEVNFQTPHEFSKADRGQRGSSRSRNSRREFQRRIDSVDPINEAPSITKPRNERKIQVTLSSRDFEDSARYSSKRLSEEFSKPSESTRDKIPKSAARYFTERSIRRLDIDSSYSDQVNVGVPSASQPSILLPQKTQELKLGQTRVQLNNKNPDFTPRGSRRGISKFAESAAYVELVNNNEAKQLTTSKTLNSHSQKKERTPLKSLQASFSSKSRGRSSKLNDEISGNNDSDISRGFFLEKKILEKNERVNEKPKVKTDHQHFNTSERYRPRKHNGLSSLSKKSTKELVSSSINTVTTVPTTTAFTKEVVFLLSSKKPTEAPGNRRAATSILTIKTLPKEKDLDDTLDFRGRKEFKQASYTTSITFSNQNTENLLNDISSTNLSNNRRRGNKLFNKASITKTGKEIVGENDNYPPEFKAKLAQLDNSDKSNERSELPKINKYIYYQDDEVTKIITRHLRSTDQADPLDIQSETDEIPDLILSESNISTLSEIFQGQKKRTPGTNFSTRSKQKLEEAKKLVKPELKSEEKVNPDNGSSTTLNSVKFNEESKSLQDPKRYDTFKLSSITPRTKVTISLPKIDKKIARTSKSIERGNVTIGETIRIRQNQKERITTTGTPDDVFVQSKTAYNSELTTVEKIKLETVTIRPLSSRNIDTTTVKMLSTTRRSRAWNAAYIDKNWQEPTPRSIDSHNTSRSVVSKPLTRSRGYTNRNRQISTTTMSNNETTQKSVTFKVTKRPRVWNSAYIDKNWQEPTKKSDVTSTQATVTSRNTYSSLTAEKTVQTSRRGNSRPRTATYRRHLEVSQPQNSLTGKKEVSSVAITPKYHALIKTENSTQQSIKKEPAVSLELLNKTNANETFNLIGISTSSRGNSGNSDSNIFNPARTTYLINSNASLLEQIKSTVAPLLSVLGAKAPAFAGVYRNVSSNETAAQRVTPSGSPPRFSARYRGVELFVRKPNDANSTGNASTTSFISSSITNASPGGLRPPSGVTPSSINPQGGRIIQDIERDKASRTKEAGGQRSTVYIGQEKFINYWTNDTAQNDSRVVSVEINSVASAINEGLPGSSISPLDILPNNQVQGRVTAPPGFPWKDPLDQIFGITTESPIIRASVASNTLDEPSSSRSPITARPINRLLEVFTPLLNANQLARDTSITITNDAPTVSTTVGASMTTPTTTTSTTKSTTNSRPVTTTTMTNSAPTMMTTTLLPTPTIAASTTSTMSTSTTSLFTTIGIPKQTSFGTTFDDLAFLNTLLESDYRPNSISSTPKTLTEVERLLANKILSLALSQAGPTRSPKAIQPSNASPNSLDILPASFGHSSPPIIIDLLQSTSKKPVAATTTTEPFTWKPVTDVTSITSSKQTEISTKTTTSITSTTTTSTMTPSASQIIFDTFPTHPPTIKSSNLATILNTVTSSTTIPTISFTTTVTPKVITRKPVAVRPAPPPTTTQAPLGFGASLLQAIFGRNIFAPPTSTTQKPLKKVIQTTLRPVQTTPKPISTTAAREMYAASEQINHIDYSNSLVSGSKSTSPQATTKYSPEEDAKFLLELLEASERVKKGDKKESLVLSNDDEVFLRAILSGQAKVKIPKATTEDHASKNAVLLAELLKAQGIKPSTSSNHLREPLQGISITSTTTIGPQIISTSSKRPTTPRPRPTVKAQSSTYPPPLFSNFNFGLGRPENSEQNSEGGVRNQVLTAAIGATRLFSQFLGAAITGAAQQLQSFVRNSTRYVSEAVG